MLFIDLKTQQNRIRAKIDASIARVLDHGQYIMGPEVGELEEKLSEFSGAKNAITCANGTDALLIALLACGVGTGDAVFTPSFTFVATVEAIKLTGATPVFCDVDKHTFNMCPQSLSEAIEATVNRAQLTPKAIIPVDLFGQPADYEKITKIAELEEIKVISDAAQSFGAEQNGKKVGTFGHITTTSFFPAKPLGCYGDGGALFSDDDELAKIIRSIKNHGEGLDQYDNILIGMNSRLDTLQAAILLEKLKIFPDEVVARGKIAERYSRSLPDSLIAQRTLDRTTSVWAQYTITSENREELRKQLSEKGIPTAVYYPKPNHLQAPYINDPCAPNGLKNTEHLQSRVLSLPMHPYLTLPDQNSILDIVKIATHAN